MILVEIELENYKQFAGKHRFTPTPDGVVGIIGANGVGKTTLFEAIEWCLYNPREIRNEEVPPRQGVGATKVRVTLEDPRDNTRYVVERRLRHKLVSAEVYREDRPEAPIVQGSRQVTEYVQRQLVGLPHRAFVSTFFTRQKELSFFGNLKETDRRREVGRLLGMETIRAAQVLISEDRNQARADADSLKNHFEREMAGRDFAAELTAAESVIAARRAESDEAAQRLAAASQALLAAREQLKHWQELERRDSTLAIELARVEGEAGAVAARLEAALAELRRLDDAASERETLLPLAAAEPELAAAVASHEEERERFAQQRQLDDAISRATRGQRDAAASLAGAVAKHASAARTIAGWVWTDGDAADPVAAAARLGEVVAGLDVVAADARAAALTEWAGLAAERAKAEKRLVQYRALLDKYERQRSEILAGGDPALAAERARHGREAAVKEAQAAETQGQHAENTRKQLEPLVESLRGRRFGDHCPTCGRPFSEHQAELTVAALEDRIADLRAEEAAMFKRQQQAIAGAKRYERAAVEEQHRAKTLDELNGRIANGRPQVEDTQAEFEEAARQCAEALGRCGLDYEPDPAEVDEASAHAQLLHKIAATLPLVQRIGDEAARCQADEQVAREALTALGPVHYNADEHRQAENELRQARAAMERIGWIDRDLERRPDLERQRDDEMAKRERLCVEHRALLAKRDEVGFDADALNAAADRERAAEDAERAVMEAGEAARNALRDASTYRDQLRKEHQRIRELGEQAEARAKDADQLDQMYREFSVFEQYVAGRVTPQLADYTSELLDTVTAGKYSQVEFDANYGLRIYDGQEECFPIEEFSGGERDVAALCARLALSRVLGNQASHPPSFLVLDEVFGSLDRDRRMQTLETLGNLSGTADAFRQVFIISHVDDVRASPIFDEIWRISEVNDVSHLENLTHTGSGEEL